MLPVEALLPEIRAQLQARNTLILQAAPGAGKSTWLPVQLLDEPWLENKKILLLEPRRLAVKSVASRLAWQLGDSVGKTVGYRIRFENKTSGDTRLEVITEGILTRMLLADNALEEIGLIILDEFHERSLNLDTAFVLSRECQKILRPDLRILVMSATLPGEKIARCMDNCPVLRSEGRQHPIDIQYAPAPAGDQKIHSLAARAVLKALQEEEGDLLVFLPGKGEIEATAEKLSDAVSGKKIRVVPLLGDQELSKQEEALIPDPNGWRKVVLSTPIAETSLTIEGIRIVVDSGYSRVPVYDPGSGLTRLVLQRISRESADQRAGRAGRLGPGKAIRLWTQGEHAWLAESRKPEILDSDLSGLALELADWGLDPLQAEWPDPPPAGAVAQANQWLNTIGALEGNQLTPYGRKLLRLPAHPRLAALMIASEKPGLQNLATALAALLEEKDPLPDAGADIELRLEAWLRWSQKEPHGANVPVLQRLERHRTQWKSLLNAQGFFTHSEISRCGELLSAAFPERIARQTEPGSGRYRLASGRYARLREPDTLTAFEWIVIARMDAGNQEGKIFWAAPLDIRTQEIHFRTESRIEWNAAQKELQCSSRIHLYGLPVSIRPLANPDPEEVGRVLLQAVRQSRGELLDWNEQVMALLARLNSLRLWRPEESWPGGNREELLESAEEWLLPRLQGIRNAAGFKNLNLAAIVRESLDWNLQQRLAHLAPETITVPTGSAIRLQYQSDGSAPVLAVRLQEMFGVAETPTVNEGRTPVLLHLLSPGYKPVQVTRDLRNFWNHTYFEVRKDLKNRYPKHAWPDDPWNAEPVRKGRSAK